MIGASSRHGSIGGELFRNVLAGDFAGAAYPVNAHAEPVSGVRAYSSIEEILTRSTSPWWPCRASACWRPPTARCARASARCA